MELENKCKKCLAEKALTKVNVKWGKAFAVWREAKHSKNCRCAK